MGRSKSVLIAAAFLTSSSVATIGSRLVVQGSSIKSFLCVQFHYGLIVK